MCVCAAEPPVDSTFQHLNSERERKRYNYQNKLEEKMWHVIRALPQY